MIRPPSVPVAIVLMGLALLPLAAGLSPAEAQEPCECVCPPEGYVLVPVAPGDDASKAAEDAIQKAIEAMAPQP